MPSDDGSGARSGTGWHVHWGAIDYGRPFTPRGTIAETPEPAATLMKAGYKYEGNGHCKCCSGEGMWSRPGEMPWQWRCTACAKRELANDAKQPPSP